VAEQSPAAETRLTGSDWQDDAYLAYYGLREKPFSLLPDPAFFYTSSRHRKALAKLRSGILNRAGTTLISGEIGAGKTTLVQHLIRELDGHVTIGLISNVHARFDNLLEWVLQAFGIELDEQSDIRLHRAFVRFVENQQQQGRRALLFIDEAQNMPATVLEELRTLMNINVDYPAFQVVLSGQPELRDILVRPDMRQFAQRIAVEHHLRGLDEAETGAYIRHRLQVVGGDPALFETEACQLIHHYCQGIPRLINSQCDAILEYGHELQRAVIDADLASELLSEGDSDRLLALSVRQALGSAGPSESAPAPAATTRPLNGTQPAAQQERADAAERGKTPAERPKNLDDALKTLSGLLD
jgi:type II secretory pathway predicted ATPase ExeA